MISIYVLPNLFTTGNMFFGFYSIILSLQGKFEKAAWAILVAMLMDVLDGSIARLTKSTSSFGMEYDSLCDLISFGVAPALLAYCWMLSSLGRIGWLISFLFVACGALRLARFNIISTTTNNKNFKGLPIPAAAGLVSTFFLFSTRINHLVTPKILLFVLCCIMITASFLMVSRITYIAFKGTASKKHIHTAIFCFIMAIFIVASNPKIFLFICFLGYALSGPILSGQLKRAFCPELERENGV